MCDTSYADDYMLRMLIQDCNTAIQACSVTFSIVFRHYSAFGFVVHLKKGKSAALFALRGKGKLQVETELYNKSDFVIKFDACGKQQSLHVALDYKHVGCFLQCNGSHAKEFRHRSGTAGSSLTLLRRKVFSRAALAQRTKSIVTQAISFGHLYNGKHTASCPAPASTKAIGQYTSE